MLLYCFYLLRPSPSLPSKMDAYVSKVRRNVVFLPLTDHGFLGLSCPGQGDRSCPRTVVSVTPVRCHYTVFFLSWVGIVTTV